MVRNFYSIFIYLLALLINPLWADLQDNSAHTGNGLSFISSPEQLQAFYEYDNTLMIASPGRSGSTLLTHSVIHSVKNCLVLQTHILPPSKEYQGKILFIFSNPDQAAESALHLTIQDGHFGLLHFYNLQSSDKAWLGRIGNTTCQNLTYNLLAYDALGVGLQLLQWLHETQPCSPREAQILAIKYEHLWDSQTIQAIQEFLQISDFYLPPKKQRGYSLDQLTPREIELRKIYNLSKTVYPRYQAYDMARYLWRKAPPFQYLKL